MWAWESFFFFFELKKVQEMMIPGAHSGKESAYQCKRLRRYEFDPWVGKIPWRRKWQTASVFLPGESHGQRSLVGYSPWGCRELDMTEPTCTRQIIMISGEHL